MNTNSPLRYPGGKQRLANFVMLLLRQNGLKDVQYAEPYAGGAGVALTLLYQEFARKVYINDLDKAIYAFWHSVLYHNEKLCRFVGEVDLTIEEWRIQREVYNQSSDDLFELGCATFYLNRTNRSGIIPKAGVIGGFAQTGKWKIDARFNRETLVKRLKKIGMYGSRVVLTNLDAIEFIDFVDRELPANSLLYLDPPYFEKGSELYKKFYVESDHELVARRMLELQRPWIVSYDYHPALINLYSDVRHIDYPLGYSAAKRYKGHEVMFFSPNLGIPHVENPSKVKQADIWQQELNL